MRTQVHPHHKHAHVRASLQPHVVRTNATIIVTVICSVRVSENMLKHGTEGQYTNFGNRNSNWLRMLTTGVAVFNYREEIYHSYRLLMQNWISPTEQRATLCSRHSNDVLDNVSDFESMKTENRKDTDFHVPLLSSSGCLKRTSIKTCCEVRKN